MIKKAFTLAEVLIVIGIIGVVAALTLPNLNHATGDKETVTRLQKAYSILNEANDRAVAIYGPVSTWDRENCSNENDFEYCYMRRLGEFLKISKSCNEWDMNAEDYASCESLSKGDMDYKYIVYQLPDDISIGISGYCSDCNCRSNSNFPADVCSAGIYVDINGPTKGQNQTGKDIFRFELSDSVGIRAYSDFSHVLAEAIEDCRINKDGEKCTWWVLEYGNLDYLKADENGVCPNGVQLSETQTSCN